MHAAHHRGRVESPQALDALFGQAISASFSFSLPGKDAAHVSFGDTQLTSDGAG